MVVQGKSMKLSKVLCLALINGFVLLIFASMLAGCQQASVHHYGYFTRFAQENNRQIASASPAHSIQKHFDIKQVYIYCMVNEKNVEQCFDKNFKNILKKYENKSGKFTEIERQKITQEINFKSIQNNTEKLAKTMLKKMDVHIKQLVNRREKFCRTNAKYYIKRCLNQYIEKDTMSVLNSYQVHNREMNGHEYLFLKNKIKNKIHISLSSSFQKLKQKEKKS